MTVKLTPFNADGSPKSPNHGKRGPDKKPRAPVYRPAKELFAKELKENYGIEVKENLSLQQAACTRLAEIASLQKKSGDLKGEAKTLNEYLLNIDKLTRTILPYVEQKLPTAGVDAETGELVSMNDFFELPSPSNEDK